MTNLDKFEQELYGIVSMFSFEIDDEHCIVTDAAYMRRFIIKSNACLYTISMVTKANNIFSYGYIEVADRINAKDYFVKLINTSCSPEVEAMFENNG